MNPTGKLILYERIAYILMLITFILIYTIEANVLYLSLLMNVMCGLALYLNWKDLRNYKEQTQIQKLWLRFVIIGSVFSFLISILAIIAVIFGYYQL